MSVVSTSGGRGRRRGRARHHPGVPVDAGEHTLRRTRCLRCSVRLPWLSIAPRGVIGQQCSRVAVMWCWTRRKPRSAFGARVGARVSADDQQIADYTLCARLFTVCRRGRSRSRGSNGRATRASASTASSTLRRWRHSLGTVGVPPQNCAAQIADPHLHPGPYRSVPWGAIGAEKPAATLLSGGVIDDDYQGFDRGDDDPGREDDDAGERGPAEPRRPTSIRVVGRARSSSASSACRVVTCRRDGGSGVCVPNHGVREAARRFLPRKVNVKEEHSLHPARRSRPATPRAASAAPAIATPAHARSHTHDAVLLLGRTSWRQLGL